MTKVDIFSGFLGAGKTTLIKKLLEESFKGEKCVLIENEFGEVGVDSGFLKDSGIEITELNSGCICCTLVGDFDKNLREVVSKFSPDRILIEPSGVGKLSDVAASVIRLEDEIGLSLCGMATIVNAKKARKQMKAFGEFFKDQIIHATAVILSRSDETGEDELSAVTDAIKEMNPKAHIITTPWKELSGEKIKDVIEGQDNLEAKALSMASHEEEEREHEHEHHHHHDHDDHDEHEHHHHDHDEHDHDEHEHHHDHDEHEHHHHHHHHEGEHDADEVFQNIGVETAQRYTREEIKKILDQLGDEEEYGRILRSKGILQDEEGKWFQFDYVPGECDFRDSGADYTGRFCVIGTQIDEKALRELFHV